MMKLMESFAVYLALVLTGLCLGSFAGASVWRLRARQLKEDGLEIGAGADNLSFLLEHKGREDRSRCLYCHHTLAWYDLVPLLSWMSLGGRCRYCRSFIGYMEPLIELAVAGFFITSFVLWPVHLIGTYVIVRFAIWLVAGVGLAILFTYDLKWFLLPDRVSYPLIALSLVFALMGVLKSANILSAAISVGIAVVILSGIYLALYAFSRGAWIGFGDVKLGLILALLLGDWKLAFLALFTANFIGCLIVIPGLVRHTMKRDTHIPFGPLLIAGFIFSAFWGHALVEWYISNLVI